MQFLYLVWIHVVAVLGGQRPAHSQVDDVSNDRQGESGAQHVLPLTHCGQDRCGESGEDCQEIKLNWRVKE